MMYVLSESSRIFIVNNIPQFFNQNTLEILIKSSNFGIIAKSKHNIKVKKDNINILSIYNFIYPSLIINHITKKGLELAKLLSKKELKYLINGWANIYLESQAEFDSFLYLKYNHEEFIKEITIQSLIE